MAADLVLQLKQPSRAARQNERRLLINVLQRANTIKNGLILNWLFCDWVEGGVWVGMVVGERAALPGQFNHALRDTRMSASNIPKGARITNRTSFLTKPPGNKVNDSTSQS